MPALSDAIRIGSRGVWLWVRLAEAVTLVLLAWHYFRVPVRNLTAFDFVVWFIIVGVVIRLHPVAHGYGDERGLTHRRYLRTRFTPWSGIREVEWSRWNTSGMVIRFASAPWYAGTIEVYENPTVREAFSQVAGKRVPTAVEWIRLQLQKAVRE
jgi:hypothetical protein